MAIVDTQEQVVVTSSNPPQQVVTKTVKQVQPTVIGEPPQKVYNQKKTLFRFNQIIWYILGLVEVLLVFRVVLKALGANQYVGFTNLIYNLTRPMVMPFVGILSTTNLGSSVIEWSTIVAAIVYLCLAWGLVYLLDLFFPITPQDVDTGTTGIN